MASVAGAIQLDGVSVGRVFQRAFSTIRHNFVVTLSLALLFGGLPGAFLDYLLNQLPIEYMVVTFGSLVLPGTVGLAFVKFFIGNVLGVLVLGAMTPPVLAEATGGRASLADSLGAVFPVIPSLIGLGIMVGLGVV